MKDDTISRQAVLDALIFDVSADRQNGKTLTVRYAEEVMKRIKALPSATDTNVGGNLIDRQAALDAIKKLEKPAPTAQHLSAIFDCEDTIKALPSAQPEHLCTVMERIKEKYAKAMNTPCIHNPMAWALYQVWKEYDK